MNFTSLQIKNFLTIGEGTVDLTNRGLLLIQGQNDEDPSAKSNGAGKSSVVDALCWALYGETARGVTGDSVVNRTAKKDSSVVVTVQDNPSDDFAYRIERYRKHGVNKNQALVFKVPNDGSAASNLSKGTDKETQLVIDKIIGCTIDVFMAAVYSGQEAMPDLPGMTDKTLKTLIEEAAGVEVLTEAYAIARAKHGAVKGACDAERASLLIAVSNEAAAAFAVTSSETIEADFEAGRKERAKAELSKTLTDRASIKGLQDQLSKFDEGALQKEAGQLEHKLTMQRTEQATMDALNRTTNARHMDTAKAKSAHSAAENAILTAQRRLAEVDSQVGKPCGECGKPYHGEDLSAVRDIRLAGLTDAKAMLPALVLAVDEAVSAEQAAYDAAIAFKATMTDVTAVALRQRAVSADLNTIAGIKTAIKTFEFEIVRHNDAAKVKLTESNPWSAATLSKKTEAQAWAARVVAITASVEKMTADVELLADAVAVFGPAGVRAHILDTVTPFLNDRTREYLGALTDGNIHATWSTLSKTSKGELREKFNIDVTNDVGADSFAGLSGGEKRKVRLATAMAMQDMVASRATKPIGLYIGDEIDHALDEAGLERLMTMLERKARERGTVLIISHNSLSDWCSNIITVTKSGGYSKVDGENLRT